MLIGSAPPSKLGRCLFRRRLSVPCTLERNTHISKRNTNRWGDGAMGVFLFRFFFARVHRRWTRFLDKVRLGDAWFSTSQVPVTPSKPFLSSFLYSQSRPPSCLSLHHQPGVAPALSYSMRLNMTGVGVAWALGSAVEVPSRGLVYTFMP